MANTHRALATAALVALTLAVAGCSGQSDPLISTAYNPKDPETWPFGKLVDQAIQDANAGSASDAQLDALSSAKAHGEVTEAQVREATEAVLQCVQDLGGTTSSISDTTSRGLWFPYFTVAGPPDMTDAAFAPLYEDCESKNRKYLINVYSQQPQAREALATALTAHEEELKQCLKDMGGHDVDTMTINELWSALKDQSFGGAEYGYSQDKDCVIDAGINW